MFGYALYARSARFSSGSANVTRFSLLHPLISVQPFPPAPIAARLSFSLGDLKPSRVSDALLPKPPAGIAPANRLPKKKYLRESLSFIFTPESLSPDREVPHLPDWSLR